MDQDGSGLCACGCGEKTAAGRRWRRGHSARGEGGYHLTPIPPPDDPTWEDAGIIDVDTPVTGVSLSGGPVPDDPPRTSPAGPPPDDEPPAHARRDWHAKPPRAAKGKPPRITAAARGDIDAKISFALEVPGRVWAARDPLCGGTFVEQRPEISRALAEIVCRSPALVAWFTGPAGGFMIYLDLMAALWPVFQAVMAHHVYHSVPEEQQAAAPDLSRFAA